MPTVGQISSAAAPIASIGLKLAGLSNPVTAGISAGLMLLSMVDKIGQGRKTANKLTGPGSLQDVLNKQLATIAASGATPEMKSQATAKAWTEFLQSANEFASQGKTPAKVVHQAVYQTPDLTNTVSSLLGRNALDPAFTRFVSSGIESGNSKGGGTGIAGALMKAAAIAAPLVIGGMKGGNAGGPMSERLPGGVASSPGGGGFGIPGLSGGGAGGGFNIGGLSVAELATLGLMGAGSALSNRSQTATQTSTPVESPEFAGIGETLRQMVGKRLNQPLPDAYETNGIKTINDTYESIGQGLHNNLTARGLSTSPIAGNAETQLALRRGGDIATFRNNIPLVENDLQNQSIAQGMQLYNAGRGTATTTRTPGNVAGGAFKGIASTLAYLRGQSGRPLTFPGGVYAG